MSSDCVALEPQFRGAQVTGFFFPLQHDFPKVEAGAGEAFEAGLNRAYRGG